jgi:Thermostable hemolysin
MTHRSVAPRDPAPRLRETQALRPLGDSLRLQSLRDGEPGRDVAESYVRERFATKHGAEVRTFMPTLVSFRNPAGELRGVAGIRGAQEGRLYLEQYLDWPIEQVLTVCAARQQGSWGGPRLIRRDEIAEVGNLAGANCRAAVRMVAQLPAYLMTRRYSWIVFTATSSVRQILSTFAAPLIELGHARAASVATTPDNWGRYYETDPRVFAGYLPDADRLAGFARRHAGH